MNYYFFVAETYSDIGGELKLISKVSSIAKVEEDKNPEQVFDLLINKLNSKYSGKPFVIVDFKKINNYL